MSMRNRLVYSRIGKIFGAVLFCIPVVYLVYSFVIVLLIGKYDYAAIMRWYTTNWPDAFDTDTVAGSCFTPQWYAGVRGHAMAWEGAILALLAFYLWNGRRVWSFLKGLLQETWRGLGAMAAVYAGSTRREKGILWALLGVILAYRLYFLLRFPLHTDEVCSYIYFVRQGLFITTTGYPLPNNHVLYNLTCLLLSKLPFLTPRLVMRLPSLAGDLFLWFGLFCVFRKWGGFLRAITVVAGVAFCYMIAYYAVQGRGYQWQELCTVAGLLGLRAWIFSENGRGERAGRAFFIVSSIAGFFLNPLYIYPFLTLLLLAGWGLIRGKDDRRLWVFAGAVLVIVLTTVVLYLPMILCYSWEGLAGNKYIVGRPLSIQTDRPVTIMEYIFNYGVPGIFVAGGALVLCCWLYARGRLRGALYSYSLLYFVGALVALALITWWKALYPVERSLCYWVLLANIIFVNVVYDVLKNYGGRRAGLLIALFLFVKIAGSVRLLYLDKYAIRNKDMVRMFYTLEDEFDALARLHPATWQITDSNDYYSMYIRLYLMERPGLGKVVFSREAAMGDVIFLADDHRATVIPKGYILWGDQRLTEFGHYLRIYVAGSLALPAGLR